MNAGTGGPRAGRDDPASAPDRVERALGTLSAVVQRAVSLSPEEAIDLWTKTSGHLEAHLGHRATGRRRSKTATRSFWRANLQGAGWLEVSAVGEGADQSVITLEHHGIPSSEDVPAWEGYWESQLTHL